MKQWIASDLHLDYTTLFDGSCSIIRPKNYITTFFNSWKHVVKDEDVVYINGDLAFKRQAYWLERLNKLPGTKVLLKGNHDRNRDTWYEKRCFAMVIPFNESLTICHDYGKILLTHIPALPKVLDTYDERFKNLSFKFYKQFKKKEYILNIHGHTHGKGKEGKDTFDASLECIDYCLTDVESIIEKVFK